jgi:hypothetical protein
MKSRRLIASPRGSGRDIVAKTGALEGQLMSALGQKQTFPRVRLMSAIPPKADIAEGDDDVRFVPKGDITRLQAEFPAALLDYLGNVSA